MRGKGERRRSEPRAEEESSRAKELSVVSSTECVYIRIYVQGREKGGIKRRGSPWERCGRLTKRARQCAGIMPCLITKRAHETSRSSHRRRVSCAYICEKNPLWE